MPSSGVITPVRGLAWGDWTRRARVYDLLGLALRRPTDCRQDLLDGLAELGCSREETRAALQPWAEALRASDASDDASFLEGLRVEHDRLFGDLAFAPLANVISPCEVIYVAESPDAHRAQLLQVYERYSYAYDRDLSRHCDCVGHIAVEFGFMVHLLRRAESGDTEAGMGSAEFLKEHLLRWVPLFAAALQHQTTNPLVRFSAVAIGEHMQCEARRQAHGNAETTGL